ncbi:hypothetical protein PoB_003829500 [Plakobranchus ocellatus]|uniref:Uncharacterized protein n=1 Tax=Plakobranchus ocellatus TaxID=259542 RepID=A0AAV4AY97_9GAST|nr:hypothetical protein PoB_003829500 [Plakobranchus ocellatus]
MQREKKKENDDEPTPFLHPRAVHAHYMITMSVLAAQVSFFLTNGVRHRLRCIYLCIGPRRVLTKSDPYNMLCLMLKNRHTTRPDRFSSIAYAAFLCSLPRLVYTSNLTNTVRSDRCTE